MINKDSLTPIAIRRGLKLGYYKRESPGVAVLLPPTGAQKVGPQEHEGHALEDPRMLRAVGARLADPSLSLEQALLVGGFKFSKKEGRIDDLNAATRRQRGGIYDADNILRSERKRQLSKRLRYIASCRRRKNHHDKEQQHTKGKFLVHSNCSYSNTISIVEKRPPWSTRCIGHNTVCMLPSTCSAIENMGRWYNKPVIPSSTGVVSSDDASYKDFTLQAAIQEQRLLQEQQSLLDQDIEERAMRIMFSSSSTYAKTDHHFKPAGLTTNDRGGFSSMNTYKPTFSKATSIDELELLQWGWGAETMMILPSSSSAIEKTPCCSFKPATAGHSVTF
jgi:hypothetical protein